MAKTMRPPSFWHRPNLASAMFAPFSALVSIAGRLRRLTVTPHRVPVPVVCVGNLVAGGAGKTPVALAVADLLRSHKHTVHFLSRGYGGSMDGPVAVDPSQHTALDVGDEPLLLAQTARTWVGRDRIATAEAAVEAGADVLVMDDGFQNPSLFKDLSLIVIDGGYGFGNRLVMPAGPLRETIADGLDRADAIVLMEPDDVDVTKTIRAHNGDIPIFGARLVPAAGAEKYAGKKVVAFAGIGRPVKFFQTVENLGCSIVHQIEFADHHPFSDEDIIPLVDAAHDLDAILLTTAKDYQRLPAEAKPMVQTVDVYLEWRDPAAVEAFLAKAQP